MSCVTLPGWDPCPCRIILITATRFEFFRINWVMFSWQMVDRDWGKKKPINIKNFWRDTPWCASRLSRGHVPSVPWYVPSVPGTFCPFSIDLHINQAQMSQVCLGRPEFVPGTPPGHPHRQIPLCDFSLSVFFSP